MYYEHIGYRATDDDLRVGDKVACSGVWMDGEPTGESLEGTCAIDANHPRALELIEQYPFRRVYKIGSTWRGYGEDEGEIIMQDAVVIEIIR